MTGPEDVILSKLEWYRMGGEAPDRQWRDVLGVLRTRADELDLDYLREWAQELGVTDLLDRRLPPMHCQAGAARMAEALRSVYRITMKILDNVFVVPGVIANCYILVDADGLTLIDAGMPRTEKKILGYIAGLGRSPQDIKRIILTHADVDHVGALAALHKASGARTYASRLEAEAIAAGKPSRPIRRRGFSLRRSLFSLLGPLMRPVPFKVDEIITDGQVLPILGGLRVVDTPGHTPGHVSLFAPSVSALFCGDSMVTDESGIHGSRPGLTWDADQARGSERRQAALGARIVCSGHGPVVMDAAGKYPH